MHPILVTLPIFGGIKIYTYGLLVASAFVVGILWTAREAKQGGLSREIVFDLAFYAILSALVGARILYVITEWHRYAAHPLDVLKLWEGGLIFYGGLIGAIVGSTVYIRRKSLPFFRTADLFMPGLALGHAIGRLGCLAAGCCHGREAFDVSWAIQFPNTPSSLAPAGIPLYPTQLMESAVSLLVFLVLVGLRKRRRFEGGLLLTYLVLYGLARILLEPFRGEEAKSFVISHWLSTSQFISILLILTAVALYPPLRKRIGR